MFFGKLLSSLLPSQIPGVLLRASSMGELECKGRWQLVAGTWEKDAAVLLAQCWGDFDQLLKGRGRNSFKIFLFHIDKTSAFWLFFLEWWFSSWGFDTEKHSLVLCRGCFYAGWCAGAVRQTNCLGSPLPLTFPRCWWFACTLCKCASLSGYNFLKWCVPRFEVPSEHSEIRFKHHG